MKCGCGLGVDEEVLKVRSVQVILPSSATSVPAHILQEI
jgi:hypothetical protein